MTDQAIASFMARAVAADRRGTQRLAQALEALAPAPDRKSRVVDLAKGEALQGELGADAGFESMWEDVANTVMSYTLVSRSDQRLRRVRARNCRPPDEQAIEVERVSDDPPERVQAWVDDGRPSPRWRNSISQMLLDLLRIEGVGCAEWEPISVIAAAEAERRTLAGDVESACARSSRRWCARRRRTVRPALRALGNEDPGPIWERARSRGTLRCTSEPVIDSDVGSLQPALSDRSGRASSGRSPTRSREKRTPSPFAGSGAASQVLAPPAAGRSSS